jgi:integrase
MCAAFCCSAFYRKEESIARKQGQIISRGDQRWQVRVYLGRDPDSGRRRYLNHTIRGSFRAAQHFLNTRLAKRGQGRELANPAMTLNQYLDRWLEMAARPRLRTRSFTDYKLLLGRYVRPTLGDEGLASLRPFDIQTMYNAMQHRRLSPRTIRYTHAVLHAALDQAVQWRLVDSNPASGIDLPKPRRAEIRVMRPDEARRFLDHIAGTRHGALFGLALTTGMRPSEYLALRWSDIDWEEETASVTRSLKKGTGWSFAQTKRTRSRRVVKLAAWVIVELRSLWLAEVTECCETSVEVRPIFRSVSGRPINSDYLARVFKRRLQEAGLPPMRLYDLRHTAATLALSAGVPAKVISEQLGHASCAFTLDVYTHVLPHLQADAVRRVEALLGLGSGDLSPAHDLKPAVALQELPDVPPQQSSEWKAS